MKVILVSRQGGKTTQLIKLCAEKGGYIVCPTIKDCERIFQLSKELNIDIPFPISWYEFINNKYCGKGVKNVLIDDLDRCLQLHSNVEITTVTLTEE